MSPAYFFSLKYSKSRQTGNGHAGDSKLCYTIQFSILMLCAKYQEDGHSGSQKKCDRNYLVSKESWRIRRRFGRNVGILKRLKNYRRFKRIFECYSFNNILEYSKIGKILLKCILFLQNMILNKAIRFISYKNRKILLCF